MRIYIFKNRMILCKYMQIYTNLCKYFHIFAYICIYSHIFDVCEFMRIMQIYANHSISNIFESRVYANYLNQIYSNRIYSIGIDFFIFAYIRIYSLCEYIRKIECMQIYSKIRPCLCPTPSTNVLLVYFLLYCCCFE